MREGRRRRRVLSEINIVPYIDVMLVLLVVFMITAPLINQGVEVNLPQQSARALPSGESRPLILTVDRVGRYYLSDSDNIAEPLSAETVLTRAAAVLRKDPTTVVLVRADASADYGSVVRGMALLQQAGAVRVGLSTEPYQEGS